MPGSGDISALTPRQAEVVRLVGRGLGNKQIAATLGISERAVEATLTRVYARLGVDSRSALIARVLSEAGFGLAPERRAAVPAGLERTASLEEEARAYEHAPFMVAVTEGPEHRYTFVNRVAAEVAGRPAPSFIGRTVREIYPEIEPLFLEALDRCFRTGIAWTTGQPALVRWTHEDGTARESLVNLIFQPVRDASGAVVGLLHIGSEVDPG